MRITPNIWCDGTALEAAEFYAGVFRDSAVTRIVVYPEDGLPDFQAHMAGRPLTVHIEIHGRPLTLINAAQVPAEPLHKLPAQLRGPRPPGRGPRRAA